MVRYTQLISKGVREMFTNHQLIKELRKPGKCEFPVIGPNDVMHVCIDKSDLIDMLSDAPGGEKANWVFVKMVGDNIRRFDIQD
jgi:hypothetical protein